MSIDVMPTELPCEVEYEVDWVEMDDGSIRHRPDVYIREIVVGGMDIYPHLPQTPEVAALLRELERQIIEDREIPARKGGY